MSYNSIVIAREIWDTRDLVGEVLNENLALKEENLSTRFEPEDMNALEMALKIKDEYSGTVTVLSLGSVKNVDVLRESLFRGVNKVIRLEDLTDKALDSLSSAKIFSKGIEKIKDFDIIFTGVNISEGENSLLGVNIAKLLDIEHASYIDNLEKLENGEIFVKRAVEMGYEVISLKLPAVISVGIALVKDDPRTPRSSKAALKLKMKKIPIDSWTAKDLEIDGSLLECVTDKIKYEAVLQKIVESKNVDFENEASLKEMLNEILK